MRILDAAPDWVTLTTASQFQPDSDEMKLLRGVVRREWYGGQNNVDIEPWGWNGYSGLEMGPLKVGLRGDGTIVRCSGPAARYIVAQPWAAIWTCTRIDLQLTARVERDVDAYIRDLLPAVMARRKGQNRRPYKVRLEQGFGDGDTLYAGSRTSALYVRVYNKFAESSFDSAYAGCVRMECEFKNGVADRLFWQLAGRPVEPELVYRFAGLALESRGIVVPELSEHGDETWFRDVPRETDADKQLAWLEKSVAGVVRKLVAQGLERDTMRALGLAREVEWASGELEQ